MSFLVAILVLAAMGCGGNDTVGASRHVTAHRLRHHSRPVGDDVGAPSCVRRPLRTPRRSR